MPKGMAWQLPKVDTPNYWGINAPEMTSEVI
jgi:hypothetical protein